MMTENQKQILEKKRRLKAEYGTLYSEVKRILFERDPIGINYGDNTDEYSPEVGTILPRVKGASCPEEVTVIVIEEFDRWFDSETVREAPESVYNSIGQEIWRSLLGER